MRIKIISSWHHKWYYGAEGAIMDAEDTGNGYYKVAPNKTVDKCDAEVLTRPFKPGDLVECLLEGPGVVKKILDPGCCDHQVVVELNNGIVSYYSENGYRCKNDVRPSLYHIDEFPECLR